MNRFREVEKLSATVRAELPRVSVLWLAALRGEVEKLTMAALSGEVSDSEFLAMVERTSKGLPGLLKHMDHDALAKLMEDGMGAAMGNGIAQRLQPRKLKAKLPHTFPHANHDPH